MGTSFSKSHDPLFSSDVAEALSELGPGLGVLEVASRLRQRLPPELARRAAELHRVRARAAARFPDSGRLFFTSRALEQATRPEVAAERSRTVAARASGAQILDGTAGAGGDALELAAGGALGLACDRDAELAACLRANLEARGHAPRVALAAAEAPPARLPLLLLDPDRRVGGRRSLDPREWSPRLDTCLSVASRFEGACLKLAPGLDVEASGLDEWVLGATERRAELVWVSAGGELTELALYLGTLAGAAEGGAPPVRRAVALGRGGARTELVDAPTSVEPLTEDAAAEVRTIAEPDPAIIRSGLVGALSERLGLRPVGPGIAFLGGEAELDGHPLAGLFRGYRVLASSPADRKRVRAMLTEHDVGPVDVRPRGHPDDAETLARKFRGRGARRGRVLVARLATGHRAYLVEPLERTASGGTAPAPSAG